MKKIIFLIIILFQCFTCHSQYDFDKSLLPLERYVGFYKIKNFYGKVFIRDNRQLILSITGDPDTELIYVRGNEFHLKGNKEYKVLFHGDKDQEFNGFTFKFPAERKRRDLIGKRTEELSAYAKDTETELTDTIDTSRFKIVFSKKDTLNAPLILEELESRYKQIIQDFEVDGMPKVLIRLYPDLVTYHNAIHTPFAPEWQVGQAWGKEEIRMTLHGADSTMLKGGAVHEFIHCVHMYKVPDKISPKWVWEGIAMFKGCCRFVDPKELDYLKAGKFPTLNQIRKDYTFQKNYDLGFFLIEFIDLTWGWEAVLKLMENSGNINKTLGISNKNFEKKFYHYLHNEYFRE